MDTGRGTSLGHPWGGGGGGGEDEYFTMIPEDTALLDSSLTSSLSSLCGVKDMETAHDVSCKEWCVYIVWNQGVLNSSNM